MFGSHFHSALYTWWRLQATSPSSVIWSESSLYQPMYYLLSILAVTDLGMFMSTLPTVLAVLWWKAQEIKTGACFAQLFFIHTFTFMESSVLLAMAFDHFIAI